MNKEYLILYQFLNIQSLVSPLFLTKYPKYQLFCRLQDFPLAIEFFFYISRVCFTRIHGQSVAFKVWSPSDFDVVWIPKGYCSWSMACWLIVPMLLYTKVLSRVSLGQRSRSHSGCHPGNQEHILPGLCFILNGTFLISSSKRMLI